jgi:hypothetical protein
VVDQHGQKIFVQLDVQDWERFVQEFKRIQNLLMLKDKLKNAFREARQIQRGEKKGTTLAEFLDEV